MYSIGEKVIYSENGVCTVEQIAPISSDTFSDKLYYHLRPLIGTGMFFSPVESNAFIRPVIGRDEAEALIASIPTIQPAVCMDSRFNHVDAFYRELFRKHTPEALVSVIKGLRIRATEKKARSTKADASMKRAREILFGELSVALGIAYSEVESFISERIGEAW